jgi:hypothetical protein
MLVQVLSYSAYTTFIVSNNVREFERVGVLMIERWVIRVLESEKSSEKKRI